MSTPLTLDVLRTTHPRLHVDVPLIRHDSHQRELVVTLLYRLEQLDHEALAFSTIYHLPNISDTQYRATDQKRLQTWVVHLSIIEAISYWKLACSPEIVVHSPEISPEALPFFEQTLREGLGEFFYRNHINGWEPNFVRFLLAAHPTQTHVPLKQETHRTFADQTVLIPVGGGKDSIVALDILQHWGAASPQQRSLVTTIVNHLPAAEAVVRIAEQKPGLVMTHVTLTRTLDPQLSLLNNAGYLNGHTPFSATLAFITTLYAWLQGWPYVALANEQSANEPNVVWNGHAINHQYSKTFVFEVAFQHHVAHFLSSQVQYFSLLRPLSEFAIAQHFATLPEYFSAFVSCNRGQKQGKWCQSCPKCLFVYVLLAAHTSLEVATRVLGAPLLELTTLEEYLDELSGVASVKSFECVGLREETRLALSLIARQCQANKKKLPALLQHAENKQVLFDVQKTQVVQSHLLQPSEQHAVPPTFLPFVTQVMYAADAPKERVIAHLRRHYQDARIAIVGFGREGRSSYHLLREIFPEKQLIICDQESLDDSGVLADRYTTIVQGLAQLPDVDVVFKTPGIALHDPLLQRHVIRGAVVTSQLRELLRVCAARTVGVTGTKGKSTTSSLIAHGLRAGGFLAVLMGNIGIPPFDTLDQLTNDSWLVIEMSSYQLEMVDRSPHVAVVLNLFNEHLNYHGTFEQYAQAKARIVQHQHSGDWRVVSAELPFPELWQSSINTRGIVFTPQHLQVLAKQASDATAAMNHLPPIVRQHNVPSAQLVCCEIFHISQQVFFSSLQHFQTLPHRMQFVGIFGGVRCIDDSLATIPEATCAALAALPQLEGLIVGGYDRGIPFESVGRCIAQHDKLPWVYIFRPSGNLIAQAIVQTWQQRAQSGEIQDLQISGKIAPIEQATEITIAARRNTISLSQTLLFVDSMNDVAIHAFQHLQEGATVLLSPASPSFGQFRNYEEKSAAFIQAFSQAKRRS